MTSSWNVLTFGSTPLCLAIIERHYTTHSLFIRSMQCSSIKNTCHMLDCSAFSHNPILIFHWTFSWYYVVNRAIYFLPRLSVISSSQMKRKEFAFSPSSLSLYHWAANESSKHCYFTNQYICSFFSLTERVSSNMLFNVPRTGVHMMEEGLMCLLSLLSIPNQTFSPVSTNVPTGIYTL